MYLLATYSQTPLLVQAHLLLEIPSTVVKISLCFIKVMIFRLDIA